MNFRKNTIVALASAGLFAFGALAGTNGAQTDLPPSPEQGAIGGIVHHYDSVRPMTTDIYNIWFEGGELAEILVTGDRGTDLDLFVFDENNNLIAFDDDLTDMCYAAFTPLWSGRFRVEIRNLGPYWNHYLLETN